MKQLKAKAKPIKAWVIKYEIEKGKLPSSIALYKKAPKGNHLYQHYIQILITPL